MSANDLRASANGLEASANDLEAAANDLEASANSLEASANDLEASANELEGSANDLEASANDLEASANELEEAANDLQEPTSGSQTLLNRQATRKKPAKRELFYSEFFTLTSLGLWILLDVLVSENEGIVSNIEALLRLSCNLVIMILRRKYVWLGGIIVSVVIIVLAIWFLASSKHFWVRRSIEALQDGTPMPDATSYRSKDGTYLIYLSDDDMVYSFYPSTSSMGICTLQHSIPVYIGYVFWEDRPGCVGFNPVKADDPQLEVHGDHFIFTSRRGHRIKVSWYGP